jgi:hypothetical protein
MVSLVHYLLAFVKPTNAVMQVSASRGSVDWEVYLQLLSKMILLHSPVTQFYTLCSAEAFSRPAGVWLDKRLRHRTSKSANKTIIIILGRVLHRRIPDQLGTFNIKG